MKLIKSNLLTGVIAVSMTACTAEQQTDFNEGWEFWSESQPTHQVINLPHDAMQTETRSADVAEGRHNGFYPGGIYHYEKKFTATADLLEKHVTIAFDGVYRKSRVYINGQEAGGASYGYIPFEVCADGLLKSGENVIRVDVDNSEMPNSRWYSGAGIYRPVKLVVQEKVHIAQVKVSTLSVAPAKVKVQTIHEGGEVAVGIYDGEAKVAEAQGDNVELTLESAKLWSAEHPNLYTAVVELKKDGKVIETQQHRFGIREIKLNAQKGLLVNGEQVLLKGGCLHHDNGVLGAAEYYDAAYRKVKILKEYGFNAIRSSHNPASEALLQACDELGMYVMDELWDMWYITKTEFDYSKDFYDNYQDDINRLVMHDYNHPSVIMYSIGNEVGEPAQEQGLALAKELIDRVHQADNSRPVTAGINIMILGLTKMGQNIFAQQSAQSTSAQPMTSEQYNMMISQTGNGMLDAVLRPGMDEVASPVLDALDVAGYNYGSRRYEVDAQLHPDRIIVGSETYPYSLPENWAMVEKQPTLIGDFMWTAWDYIGEIGLGAWYYTEGDDDFANRKYPWKLNGGGALDLLGNPTGEALWAKAIWEKDGKPYLAVRPLDKRQLVMAMWRGTNSIPSWSWSGCEGMTATVEVFTSAPSVKLYLNNKLVGEQQTTDYLATFEVPYEPGTLKAVTKAGEQTLTSATGKVGITAKSEKDSYKAGDLIYLNINLTGENGEVESKADRELTVQVEGADLLGYGSQELITEAAFLDGKYPTYYGRSQAVIRAMKAGDVKVTVSGDGVETEVVTLNVK